MMFWIKEGDIFALQDVKNYAHGCNCAGAMGKGIALQFKKKFPDMYLEYRDLCKSGEFTLGDVYTYNYDSGYIFNLGTQASWRTKAKLDAIEKSLETMLLIAHEKEIKQIALPKIGAGLGGLKWEDVKDVIKRIEKNFPHISLYIIENFKSK